MENLNKAVISMFLLLASPFTFAAVAVDDFYSIDTQNNTKIYFYPNSNDTYDNGFTGFTEASFELIQGQGNIEITPDGPTFEPDLEYSGFVRIRYTISDSDGTDEAFVYITVENSNATFQAIDDTFEVPENADTTPLNVRLNDQPGHSIIPSANLVITSGTSSEGGTVIITTVNDSPTIAYTPPSNFSGTDTFTYSLERGNDSSEATVTVNVGEEPGGGGNPVSFEAVDDTFEIQKNADTVTLDVRLNDQLDGTNGIVEVVDSISETTEGGIIAIRSESSVDYTPPNDFTGTDTFTYTLKGENGSSVATVTVNVSEEPGQNEIGMPNNLTDEEARTFAVVIAACGQDDNSLPCDEIADLPPEQQKQLAQQLSGRHTKLQARTMRQLQRQQSGNISARLREIRAKRNQVSIDGLNVAIMGESPPLGQALQGSLRGGSAGDGQLVSPWGAFINGNISIGKSKQTSTRPSYDQDGYGLTLGVDYRFSDTTVLGAAAGLGESDTDFNSMQGRQNAQSFSLISFGNYYPADNVYIDGFAMWTQGDLDVKRSVIVLPIQQHLSSDTKSQQLTAATSVGYEFNHQRWQSTLYGRLEYSDLNIDDYTETGGSLALTVQDQDTHSFTSALGTRVGYTVSWSRGVIVPAIELEYIKEGSGNINISNQFAGAVAAGSFSINADEPDTEYMSLGASVSAVFSGGNSAFIRYETLLLQDSYDFSSYSIGFRTEF